MFSLYGCLFKFICPPSERKRLEDVQYAKKHRGRIIFMCKILVRSIDFRPPCPFGIKIAPIEIQSPCDGVENVTNLYMYEQMSKSTTGCVVILNYFMSIYLLKKRNKETKTKQNTTPQTPQTKQCKQKETITQL